MTPQHRPVHRLLVLPRLALPRLPPVRRLLELPLRPARQLPVPRRPTLAQALKAAGRSAAVSKAVARPQDLKLLQTSPAGAGSRYTSPMA
ncbi:MAG: hypothetical protein AB7K71_37075 [Polyangiaceae bacterium]